MKLQTGMKIRHKYHHRGNEWDFVATVLELHDDKNVITMQLNGSGGQWFEDWNMAHTYSGLNSGEYRLSPDDRKKALGL